MRETMNDAQFQTYISNQIFGEFLTASPMSAQHIADRTNRIADRIVRALRQYQPDFEQYRQIFKEIFDDEINYMISNMFAWQKETKDDVPRDKILDRIIRTLKDSHKVLRECDVPVDPRIIRRHGRYIWPGFDPQVHVVGPMGDFTKANPSFQLTEISFCEDTVLKTNYNGVDVTIRIPGLMTAIDYNIENFKRMPGPYVQLEGLEVRFAPATCTHLRRHFRTKEPSLTSSAWTIGLEPRKDER